MSLLITNVTVVINLAVLHRMSIIRTFPTPNILLGLTSCFGHLRRLNNHTRLGCHRLRLLNQRNLRPCLLVRWTIHTLSWLRLYRNLVKLRWKLSVLLKPSGIYGN
jgi:molybdenum cofactor biosynthesis enzyme MoaA